MQYLSGKGILKAKTLTYSVLDQYFHAIHKKETQDFLYKMKSFCSFISLRQSLAVSSPEGLELTF
jgi:hypothetical protein